MVTQPLNPSLERLRGERMVASSRASLGNTGTPLLYRTALSEPNSDHLWEFSCVCLQKDHPKAEYNGTHP